MVDLNDNLPGNHAIRSFLDKLSTTTNVETWIDLPVIAVFGDTSSGKSSLLSAISGVELPASSTLTTRCPILLEMARATADETDTAATAKRAVISVQWKQHTNKNTDSNGDGVELELPAVFEERIVTEESWSQIPHFVQEAQEHILEQRGTAVANDIVSLRITGPNTNPPLTLIDLPGLVHARGTDDSETLVTDVQQLLRDYLQNPRCIIIAILAANVDFHNSQIMALAQQVDPFGRRTIPVITKPDLIDAGAEQGVLDLLMGRKLALDISRNNADGGGNLDQDSNNNIASSGFHMIKGRGQAALDRHESVHDGLEDESKYFQTVEPWKSVKDRSLFGTNALREKLGTIMIQQIQQAIPAVVLEIRERQQAAQVELEIMGSNAHLTTADRRQYYQSICATFANQLNGSLSGKGGKSKYTLTKVYNRNNHKTKNSSAAAQLHKACAEFMDQIQSGSLGTIKSVVEGARVVVTSAKGDVRGEVVHLDKHFACVDFNDETDENIEVLFEYRGYAAQEKLEVDDVWSDGSQIFVARENNVFDSLRKINLDLVRTDPYWLTDKIAENRTDDLACFLNVDIFSNIVEEFVECDWKPLCQKLMDKTREIILGAIKEAINLVFPVDSLRYPPLRRHLEQQCQTVADALIQDTQKQVRKHLDTEKHPYTQDQVLFDNIADARNQGLKRELETALKFDQSKQAVYDTEALKTIIDGVFERNRTKTIQQTLAEEMEIVLEAYGQVATKRVIDRTPMICWGLIKSLASSIQESLWSVTDETLDAAMQESTVFVTTHRALSEELEEMNKALQLLNSIL